MAHTLEELESLLEGRALVGRVLHEEPGTDHEITDVRYFRQTRIVTLKLATGDCTFTLKDVEKLLDGRKVGGMGRRWNKTYTLLPAEEEPGTEPEPKVPNLITEHDCFMSAVSEVPAKQEAPAKPRLSAKWEGRWWDVYLRFFMDGKAMPMAAAEADDVVAFARKHLEGE